MVLPVKRWFAIAFLVSAIAITQTTALAADDWQIIKVSGHDYLSVDNISKFYGLAAEVVPVGGKTQLETVNSPLELGQRSREGMINGARRWLCLPILEHDGRFLVSRTDLPKTNEPLVHPQRLPTPG